MGLEIRAGVEDADAGVGVPEVEGCKGDADGAEADEGEVGDGFGRFGF